MPKIGSCQHWLEFVSVVHKGVMGRKMMHAQGALDRSYPFRWLGRVGGSQKLSKKKFQENQGRVVRVMRIVMGVAGDG